MLDVLGFSELVLAYPESAKLDEYGNAVTEAAAPFGENLKTILFSDTVILYTLTDSPAAFHDIVITCSRLMYLLISKEIPLRGAIVHGSFGRSEDSGGAAVIAGRPIIDAYQ